MPNSRYSRQEPVAAVNSRTAPMNAAAMPSGLPEVTPRLMSDTARRPPPRTVRTRRSAVSSFLTSMVSLPVEFEGARAPGELVTEDLVDERTGLRESLVDDLPEHAAIPPRAPHQPCLLYTSDAADE